MGSILVGTCTLAFSGIAKVGWYTKDVIKTFLIFAGACFLTRTAFVGSRDTPFVVLGAKGRTAHTVVSSKQSAAITLAFTGIGVRGRSLEDVIKSFFV
jgi:hypothetical protein